MKVKPERQQEEQKSVATPRWVQELWKEEPADQIVEEPPTNLGMKVKPERQQEERKSVATPRWVQELWKHAHSKNGYGNRTEMPASQNY